MSKSWILSNVLSVFAAVFLAATMTHAEAPQAKGAEKSGPQLIVLGAIVDPMYEPFAQGFVEWVRSRAQDAGLSVAPGGGVRRAVASAKKSAVKSQKATGASRVVLDQGALLKLAGEIKAENALLIDLRARHGRIEADFRLYEVATGRLSDGGLLDVPAKSLVYETEQALETIDQRLGARPVVRSPDELRAVDLGALSAAARALSHFDRRKLGDAWREVAGRRDVLSMSIRGGLDRMASKSTTSSTQLAQLASAKGNGRRAWQHISEAAKESYAQPAGSVITLTTAADVQLGLGAAPQAKSFYKKALEVEPTNARASLGLAQVLALENRNREARRAFEKAASLDPESPVPFEMAADVSADDPALRAQYLLKAGNRHAARFESKTAQMHFAKAVQLDPQVTPRAARDAGDLFASVGEFDEALEQYGVVRETGKESATLLVVEARTQHAAGMNDEAVASYERVINDYDEGHGETLVELGTLYVDEGRAADAVPLLESARENEPEDASTNRFLARALAARNTHDDRVRALELMIDSDSDGNWEPEDLRTMAELQAENGDFAGATNTLERAAAVRALDAGVRSDIAAMTEKAGGAKADTVFDDRFAQNGIEAPSGDPLVGVYADSKGFTELTKLAVSFGAERASKGSNRVAVFQGVREPMVPMEIVMDWLMPRTTNLAGLDRAVRSALQSQYRLTQAAELGENFKKEAGNLFLFDEKVSLNVRTFTDLNIAYGSDSIFVARLQRKPADANAHVGTCWSNDHFDLELRKLTGQTDNDAKVLSNHSCLSAGVEGEFGTWNYKAAAPYMLLLFLCLFPIVRGWGKLEVDFVLPDDAAAMFAVSLKRRPSKVRDTAGKSDAADSSDIRKRLRKVRASERWLEGTHMSFRWVAARRSRYYLTIRGPIVDLKNNSVIGEFLEERTVKIDRGQTTRFKFDLVVREAMVNVVVKSGERELPRAQVSLRGVPGSTRFCPDGKGTIYAPVGEHVLVVGAEDRVAEQTIRIEGLAPMNVNMNVEYECIFEDCSEAVQPYLEADYVTASRILAEAGQDVVAAKIAELRPAPVIGVVSAAQGAGSSGEETAVSFYASETPVVTRTPEESVEAARVHEEAEEYALAAVAYREVKDLANAARCYVEIYDWPNAIECYQDLGDTENLLNLLERSGEYYDAGMLAAEADQFDRAISDLQQVDTRHPRYSECCRELGKILGARGEVDLALDKFNEGLEISGGAEAPLEMLTSFASLLEQAGRTEEALGIYEGIRRRDVHYANVNTSIERVRKQLTQGQAVAVDNDRTTVAARPGAVATMDSRYEIQSELGRGGMGVVYRAMDKHLQRTVALKVLPEHLRQHEAALELFLREARSAAALNHRNIVTVYDAGQEGEKDFISMECLEGTGLDAVLKRRGALASQVVASIGLQVAAGLDYAQKHKIIHRDIKPSNLFLTTERIIKIMDFGLAKMVEEVRRASTIIGGTPNYMAPEQAVGNPTDHRADLYALGGTLFHLLTGTVPYESGDVTYQHAHAPAPDPRERLASVEPEMARLVMKLMAKAPEDRYQSAREVGVDLAAFMKASQ